MTLRKFLKTIAKLLIPFAVVSIIILFSCNSTDKAHKGELAKSITVDTISLLKQKVFSDLALKLELAPINKGVDSFEMRLWISSMLVEHDLIVLSYEDTSWSTHKIRYYRNQDGVTYFKAKINPKISLPILIDSLTQMQFDKIISQEEIPSFVDNVADGVTYNLEIAKKGSYKILTYHCPEHFAKMEINNKKFLEFVFLLDQYFQFWSPICSI